MIELPPLYTQYQFTPEELALGFNLSELTVARLQATAAEKVQSILSLRFDPANPGVFLQEEAYLKGQLELIAEILSTPAAPSTQAV